MRINFFLIIFTRWCTWANMVMRVDKCSTFGLKKSSTSSIQYLPKLLINQAVVPTVEMGKSFKYLGRYFNFSMDNVDHMSEVLGLINDLLSKIDAIPCHPKISFFYIFGLSCLNYDGILPSLTSVRHGLLKTSIALYLDTFVNGSSCLVVLPLVRFSYLNLSTV